MIAKIANYLLLAVQWLLVLVGLLTVLMAVSLYIWDLRLAAVAPPLRDEKTYYIVLFFQRFVTTLSIGLCALGLGAALFYLRRLFLVRQSKQRA